MTSVSQPSRVSFYKYWLGRRAVTKNRNMKKLLLICLVAFTACQSGKDRPYIVFTAYGDGWVKSSTSIRCDSVKLFDKSHARVYIDGSATDVYADEILISSNDN